MSRQLDFIKIEKKMYSAKDIVKRMKRQARDWEKIFVKDIPDEEIFSKVHKEHLKCNNKKTNNPIKIWAKDPSKHLTKDDMQIINKHMKRCPTSYVIKEL